MGMTGMALIGKIRAAGTGTAGPESRRLQWARRAIQGRREPCARPERLRSDPLPGFWGRKSKTREFAPVCMLKTSATIIGGLTPPR